MKFSSKLAAAALFGRSLCPGDKNWKDAALAAIIAKNELLDKDGAARKLITNGSTDSEIAELKQMLEQQQLQQQQQAQSLTPRKKGFFASFVRGFKGEPL